MLGKWAQNQNSQTTIEASECFNELLICSGIEVTSLMAWVSWKYSDENFAAGKNVNVAFASYFTTQAWLKIYVSE